MEPGVPVVSISQLTVLNTTKMYLKLLVLAALACAASSVSISSRSRTSMTEWETAINLLTTTHKHKLEYSKIPRVINLNGYDHEDIKVKSDDGYTIHIHRIPRGKNSKRYSTPGTPVILHHGIFSSSASWALQDPSQGLAYLLADLGYDVWMPNARGNQYSNDDQLIRHSDKDFWQFSWDEMAYYDIPAVIDKVLKETGVSQVSYVGHSMGTTIFFAAMAARPEYNDKINLMVALAPIAYAGNMRSYYHDVAELWSPTEKFLEAVGVYQLMPYRLWVSVLLNLFCGINREVEKVCYDVISTATGFDNDLFNRTLFPYVIGHHPAGTSIYTLGHYAQEILSGKFCRYDYGEDGNLEKYNQADPPEYDTSQITAPIALFYGLEDFLADTTDVLRLAGELPNVVTLKAVDNEKFQHLDFLFAEDVVDLLYNDVIDLIETYNS